MHLVVKSLFRKCIFWGKNAKFEKRQQLFPPHYQLSRGGRERRESDFRNIPHQVKCFSPTPELESLVIQMPFESRYTLPNFFFNFRNLCVSVAVFRYILQNILQYMTKYRDTYTYITEIEKNLGECMPKS
jgi:hypothetical protein